MYNLITNIIELSLEDFVTLFILAIIYIMIVAALIDTLIKNILKSTKISEEQLIDLNKKIEAFYLKTK